MLLFTGWVESQKKQKKPLRIWREFFGQEGITKKEKENIIANVGIFQISSIVSMSIFNELQFHGVLMN